MGSKLKRTEAEMPVNGDGSHSHSAGKKKKKIKSSAPSAEPYDQVAVDGDQVKRKEVEVEVAVDADEAKKKKKKKKKKSKEAKNREADGIHTEDINPAETENGIENGGKKEKKRNRSKGGNGDVSVSGHGSEDVKYRALESFEAAGLPHHVLQCCKNFEKPSPIQAQAWPYLLDDRDFIGIAATGSGSSKAESLWLASTPSKRWGEIFFMAYTPFWLILCLGIVVPYRLYERFTELDYLVLGLVSALPSFMLPFVLVGKGDKSKHWFECYWAKASLWIIIFSYVGNYFWTHYFFAVLGASYTFPSWRMNNVPHTTFLLTHACFLFYHVASNITLRRVRHAISDLPSHVQWAIQAIWILTLSYIIALLETFAIANFPYYDFVDRAAMYKVGSLFYAIYFIVSFPMFMRLDEKPNDPWSLSRTAIDALAAAMIVTIILDLWRLFLGPIVEIPTSIPYKECLSYGLPWMS